MYVLHDIWLDELFWICMIFFEKLNLPKLRPIGFLQFFSLLPDVFLSRTKKRCHRGKCCKPHRPWQVYPATSLSISAWHNKCKVNSRVKSLGLFKTAWRNSCFGDDELKFLFPKAGGGKWVVFSFLGDLTMKMSCCFDMFIDWDIHSFNRFHERGWCGSCKINCKQEKKHSKPTWTLQKKTCVVSLMSWRSFYLEGADI